MNDESSHLDRVIEMHLRKTTWTRADIDLLISIAQADLLCRLATMMSVPGTTWQAVAAAELRRLKEDADD